MANFDDLQGAVAQFGANNKGVYGWVNAADVK